MTKRTTSSQRADLTQEFFTPIHLVANLLKRYPKKTWSNHKLTFLDNSAGSGNFLFAIKKLLMAGHGDERQILENQIFAVEIMPDNLMELQERLGYLVRDGKNNLIPNPLLDRNHFWDDPITHELPDGSKPPSHYLHHRNIVCADALKYNYSFGRDD